MLSSITIADVTSNLQRIMAIAHKAPHSKNAMRQPHTPDSYINIADTIKGPNIPAIEAKVFPIIKQILHD